ncbi:MAG: hypothetical protein WCC48_16595 [Anaeromyxobacteraceae bacterium]
MPHLPVSPADAGNATRSGLAVVALLALAVCAYSTTLPNEFTWDDEYVLLQNDAVRSLSNVSTFFSNAATSSSYGGLVVYRPLRTLAFALAYHAWGLAPLGYHLVNLLLHLVNVLLVRALARRYLGDPRWALLAAALFAVHPLNSEAVAGVVGMGDLLSTAFVLAALRLHADLAPAGVVDWRRAAGVVALSCGALLSKETALVLPLLVVAHELLLGERLVRFGRARLAYLGALFASAAGFFALRTAVIGGLNAGRYEGLTFARTMWMQADVLARYLRFLVAPAGLSVRHAIRIPSSFFEPRIVLSVAAIAGCVAAAVAARRRAPVLAFGIAWFFIALLPVMNLVPLPGAMMGERFCYLPSVGAFLAMAEALRRAAETRGRVLVLAGAGGAVAALTAATFVRCQDWRDNVTLFEAAVRVAPESNAVRVNLIREYGRRQQPERARLHLEAAARNTRAYAERYVTLGEVAETKGDRGEASGWYRRALGLAPSDARAQAGLARLGRRAGSSP